MVKLIDFGIASRANSTVLTSSATPEYGPAPCSLFSWRPSYDLFAVGVIAFELVTGTSPFVDGLPARGRATSGCDPVAAPVLRLIERADQHRILTSGSRTLSTMRPSSPPSPSSPDAGTSRTHEPLPVAEAAAPADAGMADLYEWAVEVARRRQLGVREYKRSLMITPGSNP